MKYIAKFNGQVVGKRKSDRVYTHAIVVQANEAKARERAYGYQATKTDRDNFVYATLIAEQGIRHPHADRRWDAQSIATIQHALECVEGGFDAYVGRLRDQAIERFEHSKAKGGFEPHVVAWAGRPDLARKRAAEVGSSLLGIVEAETTS